MTQRASAGQIGYVAVEGAALYVHPTDLSVLAWMTAGTPVDVLFGPHEGLYEIRYLGTDGWIRAEELTLGDGSVASGPAASTTVVEAPAVTWLPAYTYVQQRNLSCEYASVTIATGMLGSPISEYDMEAYTGYSDNPHWGYRGNINGWWGNTVDYGVYASALVGGLNAYGFNATPFYGDQSTLMAELNAGHPTLVWLGMLGDQSHEEYTADGTAFQLTVGMHCMTAYACDESGVYISDPATGSTQYYDWTTFNWMWSIIDQMALAVSW